MLDQTSSENNSSAAIASSTTTVPPLSEIIHSQQAGEHNGDSVATIAVNSMIFRDSVSTLENGGKFSGVPLVQGERIVALRDEIEMLPGHDYNHTHKPAQGGSGSELLPDPSTVQRCGEDSLRIAMPPSSTNPLFAPPPLYGPPSFKRNIQCYVFRILSFVLSLTFMVLVVVGAVFSSIPTIFKNTWIQLTLRNPDKRRPHYEEEKLRERIRKESDESWKKRSSKEISRTRLDGNVERDVGFEEFTPTEGGPDPLIRDIGYYARRVGLDVKEFKVQTEDGFIISLYHVYNPLDFAPLTEAERAAQESDTLVDSPPFGASRSFKRPKFPILMMHGLLQSAGVYCANDEESLAFYLCKEGYDVWLGNNRCGFQPEHTVFNYADPRMWAWNVRQMSVMDLPALISRVLSETGFEKLGLIGHSQGTTQAFIALSKNQRPDLGDKLTVVCALAPAAYSGSHLEKPYFKFMRLISPRVFRMIFGIHAFIPMMLTTYAIVPKRIYGAMGYQVFSFLFNWCDDRWDRGLRDRMFQFSPVYLSAEHMRWWLGRDSFAEQKCILATKDECLAEDEADEIEDLYSNGTEKHLNENEEEKQYLDSTGKKKEGNSKGNRAWFNDQVPPFALWVTGNDNLVDGRRLLRRFERGREPFVRVVHQKVIEEYEHLDVIWAIDVIEKVGREVKETLWKTCNVRDKVRVPRGCEHIAPCIYGSKEK